MATRSSKTERPVSKSKPAPGKSKTKPATPKKKSPATTAAPKTKKSPTKKSPTSPTKKSPTKKSPARRSKSPAPRPSILRRLRGDRAIAAAEKLQSHAATATNFWIKRVEIAPPLSAAELVTVEQGLNATLPPSYVRFVTEVGLLAAYDQHDGEYYRMLRPEEALEIARHKLDEVDEEIAFRSDEGEQAEAEAFRRLRGTWERLYFFQYCASAAVSDFYVFDLGRRDGRGELRVDALFHDDYEFAVDGTEPFHGFDDHLQQLVDRALKGQ